MITSGRNPRLPRSYQPGRLLRLVQGDLPGHLLEHADDGVCRFVPTEGGPTIEVTERVDKRFLGHIETARFMVRMPAPGSGPARLSIRHRGRFKREGIVVEVVSGDDAAHLLADDIGSDVDFARATNPLDFTRFEVEWDEGLWIATVELMGASFVSLALPPMRSYVRLHADQRDSLIASLTALSSLVVCR